MRGCGFVVACLLTITTPAQAQGVTATAQVYDRITAFALPEGFLGAYENEADGRYLLEFVLEGQSVEDWTQMITLSGAQGLALQMPAPLDVAAAIGAGFRDSCPESYRGSDEGAQQVAGADAAHLVMFSCGAVGAETESALILVAASGADVFTLQWAERGAAMPPDPDVWLPRFDTLLSLRLCPPVAGEEPPYPSCNP
jgi:hypothetical protein